MQKRVLVRVQARGGKFLGPDIGYSFITVRDALTGEVLVQDSAIGSSGNLVGAPQPGVSHHVVVAPDGYVWWLAPPAATFDQMIEMDKARFLEITAAALTNGLPNHFTTSVRTWIFHDEPEKPIDLVLPGLNVEILKPGVLNPATRNLTLEALVTMMCGCKIENQIDAPTPHWPWQPAMFHVIAKVRCLDSGSTFAQEVPMTFAGGSLYTAQLQLPSGTDFFMVVKAIQTQIEPNAGVGEGYFSIGG